MRTQSLFERGRELVVLQQDVAVLLQDFSELLEDVTVLLQPLVVLLQDVNCPCRSLRRASWVVGGNDVNRLLQRPMPSA